MDNFLKIAGIVKESIVDGPGIRLTVFTQGCPHKCRGCHNPHTHSFDEGKYMNISDIINMVSENPLLDGITLSGGEPFVQAEKCAALAEGIKRLGLSVITYTGYIYEEIIKGADNKNNWLSLLDNTDILIDGRFEMGKRDLMLKFRGSTNQRIIDVDKSRAEGRIVAADI